MKVKINTLVGKGKIKLIADICYYGIEWNRNLEGEDDGYILGGLETTAHIVSCCIVQWIGFDSCGTDETRDFLQFTLAAQAKEKHKFSVEKWENLITDYLNLMVYDSEQDN